MNSTQQDIPFVGLHAHSTFSVFDGFGFPSEHMDRAHAHGMDALALTDHGNMNGLSYQNLQFIHNRFSVRQVGILFSMVPLLSAISVSIFRRASQRQIQSLFWMLID